jgi:hypothetical protein
MTALRVGTLASVHPRTTRTALMTQRKMRRRRILVDDDDDDDDDDPSRLDMVMKKSMVDKFLLPRSNCY